MAVVLTCLVPAAASAHPLGNFTVNRYSRIEPAGDRVRVHYVLDMAEIPTFQDKPAIDGNADGYADNQAESIRQNLHLSLDGQPASLRLEQRTLSLPEGQGGLATARLEATYVAELPPGLARSVALAYRDDNQPTRIGWREIVAQPGSAGTALEGASVPEADLSNELRQYPDDLLASPPNVSTASLRFVPGAPLEGSLARPPAARELPRAASAFADLAAARELSASFVLFALAAAVALGMGHALQPGHGKTIVAAYLIGSRGTPVHAAFLGATVTVTHTIGVYALGIVTLYLSQYVVPERLYPMLETFSGALVVAIGVWLLGKRTLQALRRRSGQAPGVHRHGLHAHVHDHHHDHVHAHTRQRVGWRGLLALGISGGLLPCPEALMVLLITIAAHRVLFGLLLIVAFSIGLASVLVGFGLVLVYARAAFQRIDFSTGLVPRLLPVASAVVIVVAGCVITAQALPQVL
jgi:nickel/cobalt exporter